MRQHKMAINTFLPCLERVVDHEFTTNDASKADPTHKRRDLPNDGILDTSFSFDKISAMLRAMDVNIIGAGVPSPKILTSSGYNSVTSYNISEKFIRLNLEGGETIEVIK